MENPGKGGWKGRKENGFRGDCASNLAEAMKVVAAENGSCSHSTRTKKAIQQEFHKMPSRKSEQRKRKDR